MNIEYKDIIELGLSIGALVLFLVAVIVFEMLINRKLHAQLKRCELKHRNDIAENDEIFKEEINNSYLVAKTRTENRIKNMSSEELYEFLKN